ncbi:hypothetical protein FQA39_LY19193, partial [Lamprigera yunnana]
KTFVGDLITQSSVTAQRVKEQMLISHKEEFVNKIFGSGTKIPEPVFFCSVEPPSLAYQNSLDEALDELQREDPSLRITHDAETGQIILAGMGELHLEIIKDRIHKEYKIEVDLGPLQIAYREAPLDKISDEMTNDVKIGNTKHVVTVSLSLKPAIVEDETQVLKFDKSPEAASNFAHISHRHIQAIQQGIKIALSSCFPKINSQVTNAQITVHRFETSKRTSESIMSASVTQCLQKMLRNVGTHILEPIMILEIVATEESLSNILADLGKRRVNVLNISLRGNSK